MIVVPAQEGTPTAVVVVIIVPGFPQHYGMALNGRGTYDTDLYQLTGWQVHIAILGWLESRRTTVG